jgi:hypothetical protein
MMNQNLQERAIEYATLSSIAIDLKTPLGRGQDGSVWKTNRKTAVKVLERERNYRIELECYQRLEAHGIIRLQGFAIPRLVAFDDRLLAIEMGIVSPPFILDFAKCWLDNPPDYSPEVLDDDKARGQELFGVRWPEVVSLVWGLRRFGIYYQDAKPANITFGDDEE